MLLRVQFEPQLYVKAFESLNLKKKTSCATSSFKNIDELLVRVKWQLSVKIE